MKEKTLFQIISCSRGFAVIVPMAVLMSCLFGMTGVWLSYPVTEIIVALAGGGWHVKEKQKR